MVLPSLRVIKNVFGAKFINFCTVYLVTLVAPNGMLSCKILITKRNINQDVIIINFNRLPLARSTGLRLIASLRAMPNSAALCVASTQLTLDFTFLVFVLKKGKKNTKTLNNSTDWCSLYIIPKPKKYLILRRPSRPLHQMDFVLQYTNWVPLSWPY